MTEGAMDAPPQQPGQQAHNNTANTQATTDTVLPPVAVAAASPAEMSAPSSPSAVAVSAPPIAAVAPASSDGSSSSSSRRITRLHLESTRPLSPRSPTRYQPVSAALAAQNTAREWMRQNSQPTSPAQLDRESTLSDPAHGSLDRQQTSSHAARGRAAAAFPVAGAEASSSEAMRPQSAPSVQPAPRVSFSAGAEPTALQLADPTHVHVHVSLEGTPRHSFVMGAGAAGLVPRSSDESQRSSPRNSPRAPAGSMVAVSVSSTAGTVCSTGGGGGAKPSTRSHVSPLSIASIEMQAPLLPSPSERFDEISEQKTQLETPPLRPILRSATSFSPAPCPSPSPPQTPTAVPTLLNVRPPSLSRTNTASTVHRRGASGNVSFQGASNGLDDFDCEEHLPPLRAHMQAPRSRFFIDPDGRSKVLWSLALVLLIIYSLFEVPLSIGFSYTNTPASSAILYFIDCFFVLDVFLNFLTGFHDEQLELVTDMRRIARNYLRGWFVPDSLGSIPFELIALASGSREDRAKVFLVLRALKIPRLLRVVKLTAFFDLRSHRYLREGIRMVKLVFVMIVMGHWVACGFMLVANNEAEGVRTWAEPVRGHPLGEQFTFALYWSLTVLSTVGFGDIVPITQSEMMYTCAVMLMGAILYAVSFALRFSRCTRLVPPLPPPVWSSSLLTLSLRFLFFVWFAFVRLAC